MSAGKEKISYMSAGKEQNILLCRPEKKKKSPFVHLSVKKTFTERTQIVLAQFVLTFVKKAPASVRWFIMYVL